MFNLKSEELQTSLSETVAWCRTQSITKRLTETPELLRRRNLLDQGAELTRRAVAARNRFLNRVLRRDHTKFRDWKTGMELIRQGWEIVLPPLVEELRSKELKPVRILGGAMKEVERESLVSSVIRRRSDLPREGGAKPLPKIGADLSGGRLVVFVPEENLEDGAAEVASNWFFDACNTPPWDTWVAYSDRTLLSWVPPQLVPLAQRGIDVNPEECIRWME